ncbi:MAG: DUF3034 family protein [Thermomonas sp.]
MAALACLGMTQAPFVHAGDRLLMTGGATQIEGSAGGGIVPWAVLSGYASDGQHGGTAFITHVQTGDYALDAAGVAYSFNNRVEVSYARHQLHLGTLRDRLGLPTATFGMEIIGAKLRLGGDLVYTPMPQLALSVQHKRQLNFDMPRLIGAHNDSGTDVYVSATKLFLAGAAGRNVLLNGTLRATKANQTGLLGFGGDRNAGYQTVFEGSAAVLLNPRWTVGVEYRQKPDNLGFAREDAWRDAFVGWFPNKRVAVIAAYADLGDIVTLQSQRGAYLSLQLSY